MLKFRHIAKPKTVVRNLCQKYVTKTHKQKMKINLPTSQLEWREYSYSFQYNEQKLSFDFSIKYEYHSEKRIVKINRSNLLINDEKPDETLIGNLVFQASEALFPLVLQINSFGYLVGIINHSEIVERWKSFIPRFKDYYDNPRSLNILNEIGQLYRNPEKLLKSFQKEWFYSTFFFPVYGEYGTKETVSLDYPFNNKTYDIELKVNEENDQKGKSNVSLFGYSSVNENHKLQGCFLLNADRSIHEIKLDFQFSDIQENINIFIQETKEIADRKTKINVVFKEEDEKFKNNKSFFVEEVDNDKKAPKHI